MTVTTSPNPQVDPTYEDCYVDADYIGSVYFNPQMHVWIYQFDLSSYRSANSKQAAIEGLVEQYQEWKHGRA